MTRLRLQALAARPAMHDLQSDLEGERVDDADDLCPAPEVQAAHLQGQAQGQLLCQRGNVRQGLLG